MVQDRLEGDFVLAPVGRYLNPRAHGVRQARQRRLVGVLDQGRAAHRHDRRQLQQQIAFVGRQAQHPAARQQAVAVALAGRTR